MRHRLSRLRLRQKPAHSRSMQRNLVTSLMLYETIRTTKKRAEVIRPLVDKLITISKTKVPHVAIRAINQVVTHRNASRKIMEVLKARYSDRTSGFTTMSPLGMRKGDGAEFVTLTLIGMEKPQTSDPTAKKEKVAKKPASKASKTTVSA